MSQFISTTDGKIINLESIAFLTTRLNPKSVRRGSADGGEASITYRVKGVTPVQLVVAFSAASESRSGMIPLSLVLDDDEAMNFLAQLEALGISVEAIRQKLLTPAAGEEQSS